MQLAYQPTCTLFDINIFGRLAHICVVQDYDLVIMQAVEKEL